MFGGVVGVFLCEVLQLWILFCILCMLDCRYERKEVREDDYK